MAKWSIAAVGTTRMEPMALEEVVVQMALCVLSASKRWTRATAKYVGVTAVVAAGNLVS